MIKNQLDHVSNPTMDIVAVCIPAGVIGGGSKYCFFLYLPCLLLPGTLSGF